MGDDESLVRACLPFFFTIVGVIALVAYLGYLAVEAEF